MEIVHVDRRAGAGIDIRADLSNRADVIRLASLRPKAALCCNLLEHVFEREVATRHVLEPLPSGGLVFATVPFSYPHHGDPIDIMDRPSLQELGTLFAGALLLDGTIPGAGESYRDAVVVRPWLILRHLARLPAPFLSLVRWRRSLAKLYRLFAEYRTTCAVFEKLSPDAMAVSGIEVRHGRS